MIDTSINNFVQPNDYTKFLNIFKASLKNSVSKNISSNSTSVSFAKFKPFQCQMLTKKTTVIDSLSPTFASISEQHSI